MAKKKREKVVKSKLRIFNDENYYRIEIYENKLIVLPKTHANKKTLMIILREIYDEKGNRAFKFREIAAAVEIGSRQAIEQFYSEFKRVGGDMLNFLERKIELKEVVGLIENFTLDNLFLNFNQLYEKFCNAYPNIQISTTSFQKYFSQIDAYKIFLYMLKIMNKNNLGYDQSKLILYLAENNHDPIIKKKIVDMAGLDIPDQQKINKPNLQISQQNLLYLIWFLIGLNLNYNVISLITGYSIARISELANLDTDLRKLILNSIGKHSGQVGIDEKYVKKNNNEKYWQLSVVDIKNDIPLYTRLLPNRTTEAWTIFLTEFKNIYGDPKLIVTDSCQALNNAVKQVFPKVKHQFCIFHKLKNLNDKIYKDVKDPKLRNKLIQKATTMFNRKSVRSRKKAMRELESMLPIYLKDYFQEQIIDVWDELTLSLTNNAAERWNRKIKKIVLSRYRLKSIKTINLLINCLWFKELIINGVYHLNTNSTISKINIALICQEYSVGKNLVLDFERACA